MKCTMIPAPHVTSCRACSVVVILVLWTIMSTSGVHSWMHPHILHHSSKSTRGSSNCTSRNSISFCCPTTSFVLNAFKDNSNNANSILSNIQGKTMYQRAFYQITPGSDVSVHYSIVIGCRCGDWLDDGIYHSDGIILSVQSNLVQWTNVTSSL